jgi:pullulanase/glycogen debranching enzyme
MVKAATQPVNEKISDSRKLLLARIGDMSPIKVLLGKPYPLGATWRGNGVNFALYSEHATAWTFAYLTQLNRRRRGSYSRD